MDSAPLPKKKKKKWKSVKHVTKRFANSFLYTLILITILPLKVSEVCQVSKIILPLTSRLKHIFKITTYIWKKFCKMHLYNVSSVLRPRHSLMNVLASGKVINEHVIWAFSSISLFFLNQIYNYNRIFFFLSKMIGT